MNGHDIFYVGNKECITNDCAMRLLSITSLAAYLSALQTERRTMEQSVELHQMAGDMFQPASVANTNTIRPEYQELRTGFANNGVNMFEKEKPATVTPLKQAKVAARDNVYREKTKDFSSTVKIITNRMEIVRDLSLANTNEPQGADQPPVDTVQTTRLEFTSKTAQEIFERKETPVISLEDNAHKKAEDLCNVLYFPGRFSFKQTPGGA